MLNTFCWVAILTAARALSSGGGLASAAALRRISELHVERLASEGRVPVRGVRPGISENDADGVLAAAAAPFACRLLGVAAVRFVGADDACRGVAMAIALEDTPALSAGDAICFSGATQPAELDGSNFRVLHYAAIQAADTAPPGAITWADALFGKRGRSPVSVLEWSKGVAVAEERPDAPTPDA
ncbi:hypothetical protein M885DRAFT_508592 [Pelagophyceae sp. CCMP2097]|nr:hypothetical protein M885DRAFT_508592 [Pelagophyceae sp. CCMP2097]